MSYADLQQLIDAFGGVEIARVTDRDGEPYLVTAELLARAASGDPLDDQDEDTQAAVEKAMTRANAQLEAAARRIDARLAVRYTLPLAATLLDANDLPQANLDIARYLLHDDRATEEIRRRAQYYFDWLDRLAAGRAQLVGVTDETPGMSSGLVRQGSAHSGVDWSRY